MTDQKVKTKNARPTTDYKHREAFTFKGLTYRYDKPYGEWRLVQKKTASPSVPRVLYGWGGSTAKDLTTRWGTTSSDTSETPIGALQKWLASLIELRTREADEAARQAKELRAEVRRLKTRSWTPQ